MDRNCHYEIINIIENITKHYLITLNVNTHIHIIIIITNKLIELMLTLQIVKMLIDM